MQKKIVIILAAILIVGSASAYGTVVGLYTDSTGNVGIGTTNPSQKLTVFSIGNKTMLLNSTNSNGPGLTLNGTVPFVLRSTNPGDSDGSGIFTITNGSNHADLYTITPLMHIFSSGVNFRSMLILQSNINNPDPNTNYVISDLYTKAKDTNGNLRLFSLIETKGDNFTHPGENGRLRFFGAQNNAIQYPSLEINVNGDLKTHINNGPSLGTKSVYRCTGQSNGPTILPFGALTTNATSCNGSQDIGLVVP